MSETIIATRSFIVVSPSKGEIEVDLTIATPVLIEGGWYCEVFLKGLDPRSTKIRGIDGLQALSLAIGFLEQRLVGEERLGNKIAWSIGAEVPAISFISGIKEK